MEPDIVLMLTDMQRRAILELLHLRRSHMSVFIKPTIGRVVWFYTYVPGQGHKGPLDAHICKVHGDRLVNLMVVNEVGVPYGHTSVLLVQEGDAIPNGIYCTWMPYQKGQAEKTAQAEAVTDTAKRGYAGT